ncbi:hypothetical protein, partial [Massilia scottii]|uniref:hypothetical protein n=1 Tax=Massilia scottii TaxID=3057166 RepID=UPI0027966594
CTGRAAAARSGMFVNCYFEISRRDQTRLRLSPVDWSTRAIIVGERKAEQSIMLAVTDELLYS